MWLKAVVRGQWVDRILSGELWDSGALRVCSQEGDYHFLAKPAAGRSRGVDDQPEQTGGVRQGAPECVLKAPLVCTLARSLVSFCLFPPPPCVTLTCFIF